MGLPTSASLRVLVAPDCFGGTLTAAEAATAIGAGWRLGRARDVVLARPLADGGPGFVEVVHAAVGGRVRVVAVGGPDGRRVDAAWLERDGTAYVEAAQACGLHLAARRDAAGAEAATTRGVGELLAAVRDAGVRTAVVGVGGTASSDGGAGLLAALGAVAVGADGRPLDPGGTALAGCAGLEGTADLGGMRLVLASDVDNPLLGAHGAAAVFAPQKGADAAAVARLERGLARWADVLARRFGRDVRTEAGSGAGGGLGAALLALGASRESGAGLVRRLTGLDAEVRAADLVLTGEGSFDRQSLRGKLAAGVARAAAEHAVPCVVLAGQVGVDDAAAASAGVRAAYAVADHAGSVAAAMADPAATLTALARHVAAAWPERAAMRPTASGSGA